MTDTPGTEDDAANPFVEFFYHFSLFRAYRDGGTTIAMDTGTWPFPDEATEMERFNTIYDHIQHTRPDLRGAVVIGYTIRPN